MRSFPALVLFVSLIAGLCPTEAAAQKNTDGLDIQFALGFSDTVRLGRWAPLTVTIENSGRTLNGALEIEVTSGDELEGTLFTNTYRHDLELARDSRKRFHFTLFIDNFAQPVQINIISADGEPLARKSIDLRHRFTEARLVLVISRNADLDYLNETASGRMRITYPHPELLPRQWQGYDGVTALIVHGITLEQLSTAQYEALRKWLIQGGKLLVSGGPDYASLRSTRLAGLLPATPAGLTTITDATAFRATLGDSFSATRAFQVHKVTRSTGRTTVSSGDTPLVIEKTLSLGRVIYLTFDIGSYPFEGWQGMTRLWRRLMDVNKPEAARTLPNIEASVTPDIFYASRTHFPSRLIVLTFLAAYLGIIGVAYKVTTRATGARQRLQWVIWTVPLLFTPATYFLFVFLLFPPGVSAAAVTIIKPLPGATYALVEGDIGIYSNRANDFGVDIARDTPVFLPRVDTKRPDETARWIRHSGNPDRLQVADRRPYALHALWGIDIIDFDLDVTIAQTDSGLDLQARSTAGQSLKSTWLFFNNRAYAMGTVSATPETTLLAADEESMSLQDWIATTDKLQGFAVRDHIAFQTALTEQVLSFRRTSRLQLESDEALLVAVSMPPPSLVAQSASVRITEVGLLVTRLKVALLPIPGLDPEQLRPDAK